uniref:Ribosomal RNA-processing protein 43 n=1 Tax=Chromera velia CCMP2878 TaxID=1169474 RepID=A0A0G4HJK6_9ALVE|eukprot:Cvel_28292.t1-p1 / transcript=Cvel_28292.t1 / gene=Cvel_28292 / organism=Chromera_velia_CCMP2878 / gene_product=Exosome complex component rrp43, putative / transcript_product=Exosome complex component rrp43, putative / location=Cvel_scaffold3670:433-5340(-) / protein_length=254 / sequence_SO=supercontig / SO=protein_coding / is_pseudo=false
MSSSRCEVPPEVLKKVHPDLFQNEILCVGQREDGRGSTGIRPYSFCIDMFPDCCGSASVRFGGTCFVAAVKAYVSVAKEDTTITGSIGVTVDLPAICGADFEDIAGPHSQTSSSLATLLKDFISSESVIDLQQLCIEEGKAGWHLHVSVMCLEFDGNGLDVALAAAVTALEAARVETALKYDKRFKTWRLPTIEESKKKKVVLKARPLTCTFAAVGTGKSRSSRGGGGPGGSNQSDQWRWLADPSAAEEVCLPA